MRATNLGRQRLVANVKNYARADRCDWRAIGGKQGFPPASVTFKPDALNCGSVKLAFFYNNPVFHNDVSN